MAPSNTMENNNKFHLHLLSTQRVSCDAKSAFRVRVSNATRHKSYCLLVQVKKRKLDWPKFTWSASTRDGVEFLFRRFSAPYPNHRCHPLDWGCSYEHAEMIGLAATARTEMNREIPAPQGRHPAVLTASHPPCPSPTLDHPSPH